MALTPLERLELALEGVVSRVPLASVRSLSLAVRKDYATGEQFGAGGRYWRGRKPLATDGITDIERVFAQDDKIKPSLEAVVDGVLSRDPDWRLETLEGGDPGAALEEAGRLLNDWDTRSGLHEDFKEAKFAEQWAGAAYLRMYFPDDGVDLRVGDLADEEEALRGIRVMSVDALSGGALRDEHERIVGYYYLFEERVSKNETESRVEFHERERVTIFSRSGTSLTPVPGKVFANPLFRPGEPYDDRAFLMMELRRRRGSAITPGVRDAQDHLNASNTDLRQNGSLAGFPTWIFKNLQPISDSAVLLEGDVISKVGIEVGPGVTMELVGLELHDDGGNTVGYATPDAERLEPIDPEMTLREIRHWRSTLLSAFDRIWTEQALIEVSGRSRQEARASWDKRLMGEAPTVVEAVKWAIGSAWYFAHFMVNGNPGPRFRVIPRVYVDVAPANLDLYRALLEGYSANVASLTTLLQNTPIDGFDTEEERERLATESRAARGLDAPAVLPGGTPDEQGGRTMEADGGVDPTLEA